MTLGCLYGNIAEKGVYYVEDDMPQGMRCFRGPVNIFGSFREASSAADEGRIEPGTALAVFPGGSDAGDPRELEEAVVRSGLSGAVALITEERAELGPGRMANFFYGGEGAVQGHSILAAGDTLEYDLSKGSFNADITEEGAAHRRRGGRPEDLIVTEVGPGTWALTERYSRMFLLAGSERNLLIDTAFGMSDVKAAAADLCGDIDLVFLTHGHWDHIGGAGGFDHVYMNKADFGLIPEGCTDIRPEDLQPGTVVDLGERHVEVIGCPGHTPGGLCFLDRENRMLFAGDSVAEGPTYLFLDHCSAEQLLEGLRGILKRRDDFDVIYSSHRRMKLDADWAEDMIECVEKTLAGELEGQPACVARTQGSCKKYSYGKVSVFLP